MSTWEELPAGSAIKKGRIMGFGRIDPLGQCIVRFGVVTLLLGPSLKIMHEGADYLEYGDQQSSVVAAGRSRHGVCYSRLQSGHAL